MFASGIALAQPELKVWAFMGDGAFCMNPGMLMVERQMNLPNLTHFLVSNRVYGATSNAGLPNFKDNDYAAIARGMGLERVFAISSIDQLEREFPALKAANARGSHLRRARSRAVHGRGTKDRAAAVRRSRTEIPLRAAS